MVDSYLTVNGVFENLITIEKSKFICYIKGVKNEEDAKSFIEEIRKKNSLATHNCYAYIADEKGNVKKFSDDGEPQGTAGLPMLEALSNANLKKTVAVVTRYFGGIKLGTGGLNRAYSRCVLECIKISEKVKYELSKICTINFNYDYLKTFQNLIKGKNVIVSNIDYSNNVKIDFYLPTSDYNEFFDKLLEMFNGENKIENVKEDFCLYRC